MSIPHSSLWSLGEAFTLLFVTLGPLNVIGPFYAMTRGRSVASKRRLAFIASSIATIAIIVTALIGAKTLQAWGVSTGALVVAAGAILFLVALQSVLGGYKPHAAGVEAAAVGPEPSEPELALSPLAFPTIVTPYGVGLLVFLFTLYPLGSGGLQIFLSAVFVLALDLLAMLYVDRITNTPFVKRGLDILGCLMGVLLVALGVQATANGLNLLGVQIFR